MFVTVYSSYQKREYFQLSYRFLSLQTFWESWSEKDLQYNSMHTIYISLDLSFSAPTTVRKAKIQTKGDDYDSWVGLDGFSAQT